MVKDLEYRPGWVFKWGRAGRWRHAMSLLDVRHLLDVQWRGLHHGPGNHHLQMMSPVPRALTASRVSVAKAGGLSDAPGAERSPNVKDGDTVTHIITLLFNGNLNGLIFFVIFITFWLISNSSYLTFCSMDWSTMCILKHINMNLSNWVTFI